MNYTGSLQICADCGEALIGHLTACRTPPFKVRYSFSHLIEIVPGTWINERRSQDRRRKNRRRP